MDDFKDQTEPVQETDAQKIERLEREIKMLKKHPSKPAQEKDPFRNLSKKEKLEKVWELPVLPDSLFHLLVEEGFPTGSSQYSLANPGDIDYCVPVPPKVFEGFAIGSSNPYWIEDGMVPLYAHRGGKLLNIICMSDYEMFTAWFQATQVMQQLQHMEITPTRLTYADTEKNRPIQPFMHEFNIKWSRVAVFRALKEVLWPAPPKPTRLETTEALKWHRCIICHRKAEYFTDNDHRRQYKKTGICERCEPNIDPQMEAILRQEDEVRRQERRAQKDK